MSIRKFVSFQKLTCVQCKGEIAGYYSKLKKMCFDCRGKNKNEKSKMRYHQKLRHENLV